MLTARSRPRLVPGIQMMVWAVLAILSLSVGGYAIFHVATDFAHLSPSVLANIFPSPVALWLHIGASAIAIIIGPLQFLPGLRVRRPFVHRWSGRIYVIACMAGGVTGGAIALHSSAGIIAGLGFLTLAAAWVLSTGLAWRHAVKRNFALHRKWMVRSFSLTLAAVTLRLYLPVGFMLMSDAGVLHYIAIAWLCWVPNLLIAELYLAISSGSDGRVRG